MGIVVPYFFIIFSYVMIVRKYNQSRSKVLQNSASGRTKAGGKFCLVETSFFTKRCPPAYTSSTVSTAGARSRRASEDEISMCEVTQVGGVNDPLRSFTVGAFHLSKAYSSFLS